MRTPRLPVVDWTDAHADLNGLFRFAERRNPVSARVPSHIKRSLLTTCNRFSALVCCCQCPRCTLTSILCNATGCCIQLHVRQAVMLLGAVSNYTSGKPKRLLFVAIIWFMVLSTSKLEGCNSYNFKHVRKIAQSNSFTLEHPVLHFLYHKQKKIFRPA